VRKVLLVALALVALAVGPAAIPGAAAPIPETDTSAPNFLGAPATQNPVFGIQEAPRHPFMAANERSNIHVDAWQTDTNRLPGPLGRDMKRVSTAHNAVCGSVTFDTKGRIVTVCVGVTGPSGGGAGLRSRSTTCRRVSPARTRPATYSPTSPAAATSTSTTRTAPWCRPPRGTSSWWRSGSTSPASSSNAITT
jgi:hypothetical protein